MNIVIRTDSSLQIGSGHLMRCLTLAGELRSRGASVGFICRKHPGSMMPMLESKGYAVSHLEAVQTDFHGRNDDVRHAAWLGATWEVDAAETVTAMKGMKPDWLIIDHYAIDYRWEDLVRPHVGNIMVIDDLADRLHNCDLLLDQNFYDNMEQRYNGLMPEDCQLLAGPRYALLRPEFAEARWTLRQRDGIVRRLLVFYGGSDANNETAKALTAIAGLDHPDIAVDVVIGASSPHRQDIEALCRQMPNVSSYCQVENMAELMAAADLAIGAGGATSWERCSLGLPSLVTATAANQLELAETGARHGLFFYLGGAAAVTVEQISCALKVFTSLPENLKGYSARGMQAVDAKGVQRVAGIMAPPVIKMRCVTTADCDSIFEWRNAEETRRYIFGAEPIPYETHRDWFHKTLANPDRILLIGEIAGQPAGVVRYDLADSEALISVYLVPGGQGQGVGSQLIRCGSSWLRENRPEITTVNAEIFAENIASLRAFESAGYKQHHMIYKEVL